MSAFLVENTTISIILTEVEHSVRTSELFKRKLAKELSIDFQIQSGKPALVRPCWISIKRLLRIVTAIRNSL